MPNEEIEKYEIVKINRGLVDLSGFSRIVLSDGAYSLFSIGLFFNESRTLFRKTLYLFGMLFGRLHHAQMDDSDCCRRGPPGVIRHEIYNERGSRDPEV